MKRTFIAIKLSPSKSTLELINDIKFDLKDERIKWVESWNYHITLFFIGDTTDEQINNINKYLSEDISHLESFTLNCSGMGVFRNINNPKAIWFGFDKSEKLEALKSLIDNKMSILGFNISDNDFKPHVTIGRTKFISNKKNFRYVIEKYKDIQVQNFEIKEMLFYESILTAKGPEYKVLNKFILGV